VDTAEVYAISRSRLLDLARTVDGEQAGRAVPALPGWSVKDAYAHLAGVCADILDGRMDGAGSPPWTAAQVDARKAAGLAEVCAEWAGRGPQLDAWIASTGEERTAFVAIDVWSHEQDIRSTVEAPRPTDDGRIGYLVGRALPVFDRRFAEAEVPALRVVVDGTDHVLGTGEPDATLRSGGYELLRILFGRRTRTQIEHAEWDGPAAPYIEHLHLFDLPGIDLAD
jgi:uncharacterized protein (TIGR03083 family)